MLLFALWVLFSFFAVMGILYCLLGAMEYLSLRKASSLERVALRVELKGEEPRMEYLLNSLSLFCDRFSPNGKEIILEVIDGGLAPAPREELLKYCEKNPWVVFTEE